MEVWKQGRETAKDTFRTYQSSKYGKSFANLAQASSTKGWVQTDMGGKGATITSEGSAMDCARSSEAVSLRTAGVR